MEHLPHRITIGQIRASPEHVDSHVMVFPSHAAKVQWLMEMLSVLSLLGRCLVFVATKKERNPLSQIAQYSPLFMGGGGASSALRL